MEVNNEVLRNKLSWYSALLLTCPDQNQIYRHCGDVSELVDLFRFGRTMCGNGASTLTDEMNKFEGKWRKWLRNNAKA
jgi:hypothetical protein